MSSLAQRQHTKRTALENPKIADEINSATKSLHTELNRLIVDRLPFALPPSTSSPARYATGLERFASIFFAFEHALDAVAEQPIDSRDEHKVAIRRWIAELAPSGLRRTARLQDDHEHLSFCRQKLSSASAGHANLIKLSKDIKDRPHILVAYAWVMYMAIFSGGRWIRQQLSTAGPAFWLGVDEDSGIYIEDLPGHSFLSFGTQDDGEALKSAFKAHLWAADDLLAPSERQDIVHTSIEVFQQCISLIEQIDRDVWWQESTAGWSLAGPLLVFGLLYIVWLYFKGESIFLD